MRLVIKTLFILFIGAGCMSCNSQDKSNPNLAVTNDSTTLATKDDSILDHLATDSELHTKDLIPWKIVDSGFAGQLGEFYYVDTTVRVNDSIRYTIISTGDRAGVCSHIFVATIGAKAKTAIDSKYLYSDCDVDYAIDQYDLFDYLVISRSSIRVAKTTVFQKKDRTSLNETENIDHLEIAESLVTISENGQINISELLD
jgi:hypothetical protein